EGDFRFGFSAIEVEDSFLRCFKSIQSEPRNWNIYLFPLWCFGVVIRYLVLFPVRNFVPRKDFLKRGDLQSARFYVHVQPALGGTFTDIA
ncbi:hypothetical protein S83_063504, partial [Arachis hypogaea]